MLIVEEPIYLFREFLIISDKWYYINMYTKDQNHIFSIENRYIHGICDNVMQG